MIAGVLGVSVDGVGVRVKPSDEHRDVRPELQHLGNYYKTVSGLGEFLKKVLSKVSYHFGKKLSRMTEMTCCGNSACSQNAKMSKHSELGTRHPPAFYTMFIFCYRNKQVIFVVIELSCSLLPPNPKPPRLCSPHRPPILPTVRRR